MSRLSRLKSRSHGEDGKWAHDEIVRLRKQRDELLVKVAAWEQKAANWMASQEAAQRLDGYRDLAQRLNIAEQQRDELRVALEVAIDTPELQGGKWEELARTAIASVKGDAV